MSHFLKMLSYILESRSVKGDKRLVKLNYKISEA